MMNALRGLNAAVTLADIGVMPSVVDALISAGANVVVDRFGEVDGLPGLELLATLLNPAVVLEVDTYWAQVAGVDAVDLLARLGERVQLIHVKDGPITREGKDQLAIGDGAMPVLEILAGSAHRVPVVEFDGFRGDVFDAVRRSFAFLTANGRHA